MRPTGRLALGAVLALAISACSSSAAPGSPVPTDHVGLPKSYRFAPAAITVVAGTTVTWTNDDNFTHSVRLDGVASPGLVIKPGESVTSRFETPGTFAYVCTFHPQDMRGTVEVSAD